MASRAASAACGVTWTATRCVYTVVARGGDHRDHLPYWRWAEQCLGKPLSAATYSTEPQRPSTSELHQALGRELHHLAQHVDVGALLGKLGQCHSGGHRDCFWTGVGGSHLNLSRAHDGHPCMTEWTSVIRHENHRFGASNIQRLKSPLPRPS